MSNRLPSHDIIGHWLRYDATTGGFVWIREPRPARPLIGAEAGTRRRNGYVFIGLRGFPQIGAHRLAWIYVHGLIPPGMEIDHKDGNPSNNALSNLRLATSSQQKMNRATQSNNRSGLKGAFYHTAHRGKKWRAQLKSGGRYVFLGYYATPEEAHAAYVAAAPGYFGDFARTS